MKVSVIIPNYNHAEYLDKRIESILQQSFQDFEIIFLDDCSTDDSKNIIEKYRSSHKVAQIIYNDTNSGSTFKQWTKGINATQGEFIWIAESDDWCEPNFLDILVNGIEENPGCSIAYAQSYCVDNEGNIKWQSRHNKLKDCVEGKEFIQRFLLNKNSIFNASMALFKKEDYYRISKEYESFKFCGDWLFWIELACKGKVFISGRLLNYFRKHSKDVSGNAYSTGYNFIERFKLLSVLKNKNIISEAGYKSLLLTEYDNYQVKKTSFDQNEIKEIETAINSDISNQAYLKHSTSKDRKRSLKGLIKGAAKKLLD